MKKKLEYKLLFTISISLLIILLLIPVKLSGGFRGNTYYDFTNIIAYLNTKRNISCIDCYNYSINYIALIIEIIIVPVITYLIANFLFKKGK